MINKDYKSIASRAIKAGLIFAISTGIFWFGIEFGPSPGSGSVEAKVFERLFDFTRAMPDYLFNNNNGTGKPYKVIVNNNTTFLSVEKTNDDIRSVLDFYESKTSKQPMMQIDINSANIDKDDEKTKDLVIRANKFIELLEPYQNFRMERDDYGFFGAFEFHDADLKIGEEKFYTKLQKAIESGQLGKLGIGRAVIALGDSDQKETTIIKIWTDHDFNLNNLFPGPDGDIPGSDIENVPRYPGDKRILSVAQENSDTLDKIVEYRGNGSVAGHILFFHSRMQGSGWQSYSEIEKSVREKVAENLLFYTKKGREVTVQVRADDRLGGILTHITERNSKNI